MCLRIRFAFWPPICILAHFGHILEDLSHKKRSIVQFLSAMHYHGCGWGARCSGGRRSRLWHPTGSQNCQIFTDFCSRLRIFGISSRVPATRDLVLPRSFCNRCILIGAGGAPDAVGSAAHAHGASQEVKTADLHRFSLNLTHFWHILEGLSHHRAITTRFLQSVHCNRRGGCAQRGGERHTRAWRPTGSQKLPIFASLVAGGSSVEAQNSKISRKPRLQSATFRHYFSIFMIYAVLSRSQTQAV